MNTLHEEILELSEQLQALAKQRDVARKDAQNFKAELDKCLNDLRKALADNENEKQAYQMAVTCLSEKNEKLDHVIAEKRELESQKEALAKELSRLRAQMKLLSDY